MCDGWGAFVDRVVKWRREALPAQDCLGAEHKLEDEMCEFMEYPCAEELADVLVCLINYADLRFGLDDFLEVANEKMGVNERRKWNMNQDGSAQHVDE